jgi:hypothetical protein
MELRELVEALVAGDALRARVLMREAQVAHHEWSTSAQPAGLDRNGLAIAAGVVELQCQRAGLQPPAWTAVVEAADADVFLVRSALSMPRLRQLCLAEGPWPLRRRRIYVPPEFLSAA